MRKETIVILSLFDGISCIQLAIDQLKKKYNVIVYASEIDKGSIKITMHNFPDTIQLGDIRNITKDMIQHDVFLMTGGSPCQDLSIAGKKNGMTTVDNVKVTSLEQYLDLKNNNFEFAGESYLYWEYVRLLKLFKPKYFLLENVLMRGNDKVWEDVISKTLKVNPIHINSALVSAQNRDRLYWTNIPGVTIPEDRFIFIDDIIPGARNGYGFGGVFDKEFGRYVYPWTERRDHKAGCLVKRGNRDYIIFNDDSYRKLTTMEKELLQTLPAGYTDVPGVTKTIREAGIGNGWTVEVIKHILSFIPEFK